MCTFLDNSEFFFHSYVFIREPLARHSSFWRCEIVRAGSSWMSLASDETPPRCYLLLLVSAYAECSSWIFRERRREKFSGLTTNRHICEGIRRDVCREGRKKKKGPESTRGTRRVLWRFFGISLPASHRDIGPRSSDIPRELPCGIPSRGALETSTVATGWLREAVISVVLRSVEEGWGTLGISREIPCLEHVSDEIIFKQPDGLFSVLSLSLGSSSPFLYFSEKSRENWKRERNAHESLIPVLYAIYVEESQSRC